MTTAPVTFRRCTNLAGPSGGVGWGGLSAAAGTRRREETGEHGRGVRFASGAKRGSGKAAAKSKRLTGSAPLSDEFAHWHTNHLATDDLGDGEILQEERLPPVDPGEWAPVDVFDFSSLVNGGCGNTCASRALRHQLLGI